MKFPIRLIVMAVVAMVLLSWTNMLQSGDENDEIVLSKDLGEKLFFDPILSSDYSVSCSSCHKPELAFADDQKLSAGVGNSLTARNTPTVMYSDSRVILFWDGRAETLEHQAFFPITHPDEMNMDEEATISRLKQSTVYTRAFKKVFNAEPSVVLVSTALADYQRTLTYYDSPYDRFSLGDDNAISESAIRGLDLFTGKALCDNCHGGFDKSRDEFFNIGLYNGEEYNDRGRFDITKDSLDLGRFRSPILRNVELTAPYMHDGSMATLEEVLEYYNNPDDFINNSIHRDTLMNKPLGLSQQELDDLKAFMLALTDDSLKSKP